VAERAVVAAATASAVSAQETGMDWVSVSVVIPTYNRCRLIPETLDAILAQSSPPDEVIVVDDGSTDGTREVLAAYAPAVTTLTVPNGGDLAARNVGLRAATSTLVAFCDSDDLWRPDFLAAMRELRHRAPNWVAAYGNFQAIRDGVWDARTKFADAPPDFWAGLLPAGADAGVFASPILERLLRFQPFFPSAMVVDRAQFLAIGGWDEAVSRIVGTDFATALRVAEYPLGIVHRPLVGIRRHAGNFSADSQAMNLGDARILEHVLATRPAISPHEAAVRASIADRRAAAADLAFDRGDFASVRAVQAMLPGSHRTWRRRLKGWISLLPAPLARSVAALLGR
jgi:glycosyltransferase involved in cell wall biosynthesis